MVLRRQTTDDQTRPHPNSPNVGGSTHQMDATASPVDAEAQLRAGPLWNSDNPDQPYEWSRTATSHGGHGAWVDATSTPSSPTADGPSLSSLSINDPPRERKLEPHGSNNPFLQQPEEKIALEMESSASIWGSNGQPPSYFATNAPLPRITPAAAQGQMADYPTLPPIEPDDPWRDIEYLDKKTLAANGQQPVVDMRPVDRGEASHSLQTRQPEGKKPLDMDRRTAKVAQRKPVPAESPLVESPQAAAKRQTSEFYQIKHIQWHDMRSAENGPRKSPILIQNANGPCPLLALVNALVLSTPATTDTALIETLRTREQVSLGLLIDAVFDELMSGRRGETAQGLPDVGELYSFLITLHTGMNVNPRFVFPQTASLIDADEPDTANPAVGGFEDTREMRLYSTFSIPLIHGWLPRPEEPAYAAFGRTAQTYEDAQNVLFREEELEEKLRAGQLSSEEQGLYMDLTSMKGFFTYWPTQLTSHGLRAIQDHLEPGQVSILFRNDHFSMLYKEPRSDGLMTLVTDAGYATHDEIVWESLADINGTQSELFAGDFKPVGHGEPAGEANEQQAGNSKTEESGDQPRQGIKSGAIAVSDDAQGRRTVSEQEDHDLALALQLQEEEEERERSEQAARRQREEELSQRFLAQEGQPSVPPRRSHGNSLSRNAAGGNQARDAAGNQARAATANRARNAAPAADEVAPPPYEQAASSPPFHPPQGLVPGGFPRQSQPRPRRRPTARQSLIEQIPPPDAPVRTKSNDSDASNSSNDRCVMM